MRVEERDLGVVQVRIAGRGCRKKWESDNILFHFLKNLKLLIKHKNIFELDKMYKPLARKIMKKDIKQ